MGESAGYQSAFEAMFTQNTKKDTYVHCCTVADGFPQLPPYIPVPLLRVLRVLVVHRVIIPRLVCWSI